MSDKSPFNSSLGMHNAVSSDNSSAEESSSPVIVSEIHASAINIEISELANSSTGKNLSHIERQADELEAGTSIAAIDVGYNNYPSASTIIPADDVATGQNDVMMKHRSKVIFITFLSFLAIDTISFPKYIIFPQLLIDLVGGPYYLVSFWALWAFLSYSYQAYATFIFAKTVEDMTISTSINQEPSTKQALSYLRLNINYRFQYIWDRYQGNHHPLQVVEDDSQVRFSFTRAQEWGYMVFSIIDITLTIITAVITLAIIMIIFREPDKNISAGWHEEYRIAVTELVFCFLSLISRIAIIIIIPILRCYFPIIRPHHQPRIVYYRLIPASSWWYQVKAMLCMSYIIFALIALGFTSAGLHWQLSASYYKNQSTAQYSDCDNMVPQYCALPFPSYIWLANDTTTDTSLRVSMPPNTLPYTKRGVHVQGQYMNQYDGFSLSAPMIWHLPGMNEEQFVSFQYISRSLLVNSTSLLVDLSNPSDPHLHPHFTELDHLSKGSEANLIAYVQPAQAMKYDTHYAVIIQLLTDADETLLPPSSLLQSYIDAYMTSSPYESSSTVDVARYHRFVNTVFPALSSSALNVSLNQVQLIWDFHTASQSSILKPLQQVYNSTLERVQQQLHLSDDDIQADLNHISFASDLQDVTYHPHMESGHEDMIYRRVSHAHPSCDHASAMSMSSRVYYRISVPWYLQSLKKLNSRLDKDLLDLPPELVAAIPLIGDVGLYIQVPCSIALGKVEPRGLLEVGHGIFDTRAVARYDIYRKQANDEGLILWAMDWPGFTRMDMPLVSKMLLYNLEDALLELQAIVVQGFASKLAGRYIVRHILGKDSSYLNLPPTISINATALPGRFIGVSMGSILGGGYAAFAGYERAAFLVAGSPFTFLLTRSSLFELFVMLVDAQFYNRVDIRIAISSIQIILDAAETSGWSNSGVYEQMSTLTEIALGDATVTTISGRIFALNLKAVQNSPSLFPIYGIPEQSLPLTLEKGQHMLQQGTFPGDAAKISTSNSFAASTDVHGCLDTYPVIQTQTGVFLQNGTVLDVCGDSTCVYGYTANCNYKN